MMIITDTQTSEIIIMALSKAQLYASQIMCAPYDLAGIYEAHGADYIVKLVMEFARQENQTAEAYRAVANAAVQAERNIARAKSGKSPIKARGTPKLVQDGRRKAA